MNLPGWRAIQPRRQGVPCLQTGGSRAQGGGTNYGPGPPQPPRIRLSAWHQESCIRSRAPGHPAAQPGPGPTSLAAPPQLQAELSVCSSLAGRAGLVPEWGAGKHSLLATTPQRLSPCHRLVGTCGGVQRLSGHAPLLPSHVQGRDTPSPGSRLLSGCEASPLAPAACTFIPREDRLHLRPKWK